MDDRHIERAIFTSTSGPKRKSISRLSPGKDENYGRTLSMLQSVHENLGSDEDDIDTSWLLDGVEEAKVAADESLQMKKLKKETGEMRRLKWLQKRSELERQAGLNGVEEAEVMADKLPKNSDISYAVSKKEKQILTTGSLFPAYQNNATPSRFSPLRNEHQSINLAQINAVEATEVLAEGSSQRTKLAVKSHISNSASQKEKQMRSTSPSQFQSRRKKIFREHSSRYPPLCNEANELQKDRSLSPNNIAKQRFIGPFSGKTHESRRAMHNTVGEREKERGKEESLVIPTQSNVNEEVWPQSHPARKPLHNTALERDQEWVKEESLVIPTRNNVTEEVFNYPIIAQPVDGPNGYSLSSQPAVDPIWRGRFDIDIRKDDAFEGFVAHLSRSACQHAIDEAGLLPPLLQLEMVPKSTVWPKSFQRTQPIDYHIALYFFPEDRTYEKKFDLLVDHMSKREFAMRTFTKNAELLIFASTELEMPYWRFQNKYYIWGVFRGKR